jgi:uncharacterized iron-regulated protein
MKKAILILAVVLFLFVSFRMTETDAREIRVWGVKTGKAVSFVQMIDDIRKARLVFIGETHDKILHHRLQLEIIRKLHDIRVPMAVGLEMFMAENQDVLDRWVRGDISEENFIRAYYSNWNFPWPLYADIFLYAKDNKIPLIGLNLPPEISRKVALSGFSSLTKEEREKLPAETGCVVGKEYMEFIRRAYAMHGHRDKKFLYFCEAQLLWDQTMAKNLLSFLGRNPDKMVVVLTGNGHAWKRGIPEQVRLLSPKTPYRVLLPFVSGYIDPDDIAPGDADYILSP